MDLPLGFLLMLIPFYLYFIVQYFFTQLFYSKYNMLFLWIPVMILVTTVWFISPFEDRIENILYVMAFVYYAALLQCIKLFYPKLYSFFNSSNSDGKTEVKGFTYVSYHKGMYYKGHSWDEELASKPFWLDHLLSWMLVLLPLLIAFGSVYFYR